MSRLGRPPDASSPVAVGALLGANLVPLAGALWFGWAVFDVLAVYWVESGVVGLLNVPKDTARAGESGNDAGFAATVNGRPLDLSGPDESALVGFKTGFDALAHLRERGRIRRRRGDPGEAT